MMVVDLRRSTANPENRFPPIKLFMHVREKPWNSDGVAGFPGGGEEGGGARQRVGPA
jgi:hypothetical protein